jgi:hypothetical protein
MTTSADRHQFVIGRVVAAGYPAISAAAFVGNGCGESGVDLDSTFERAHADHGSGGFLEWRDSAGAPRKTRLAQFAELHGADRNDLGIQVDYAIWELGRYFPDLDAQLRNPGTRGVATLTYNFCDVFENPAPATAGKENRRIHAEAALADWESAHQAPQTAPPARIPGGAIPKGPAHVPDQPSAPVGLPPISASEAGLNAAILDNIGAMRDALASQRAAIDRKIAVLETAAADFVKLEGATISLPGALQIPAAKSAAPQPQRTGIMDSQVSAAIRNLLIFAGGTLVSTGYVDNATLVSVVGGIVSLGGAAWSAWGHKTTNVIAAAASLPEVQKIVTTAAIADSAKFATNNRVVAH